MGDPAELKKLFDEATGPALFGMRRTYIYALIDPRDFEVRYIGKSDTPWLRFFAHLRDRSRCHRVNWLTELRTLGLEPDIAILETIEGDFPWQPSEIFWIRRYRALGARLTNSTDGGDGVTNLPPETRERMRMVWKGRKHKPETIEKLKAARRIRVCSDETRKKMSIAQKGRTITWGEKISDATRKLSASDISCIEKLLSDGMMVKDVAMKFGVHRTTVSKVKMGTYTHNSSKSGRNP